MSAVQPIAIGAIVGQEIDTDGTAVGMKRAAALFTPAISMPFFRDPTSPLLTKT